MKGERLKIGQAVTYRRKPYTVLTRTGKAYTLVDKTEANYVGVHEDDPQLRKVETT